MHLVLCKHKSISVKMEKYFSECSKVQRKVYRLGGQYKVSSSSLFPFVSVLEVQLAFLSLSGYIHMFFQASS